MSRGYNLSYDYEYLNDIRKQVLDMEKKNPYWQPQLFFDNKEGGSMVPIQSGRRTVGFNNYSNYSTFYKETPKSYLSSGNDGYNYYHDNELKKINKNNFPYMNYDKNDIKNSNKNISKNDAQIYESIRDTVKNDFNKEQLRGGAKMNKIEKILYDSIVEAVKKNSEKNDMEGGISVKDVKKTLKENITPRKVAATGVRIGIPLVSGAVAQTLGVPLPVAVGLSKIGSEILARKIEGGNISIKYPKDSFNVLADEIVRSGKLSKMKGGFIDKEKFKKGIFISKALIKSIGKNLAIAGARYSMKYLLPMVAKEVAIRLNIDPTLAMELAQIAGNIIAKERPKFDSEGYIEIGKKPQGGKVMSREERHLYNAMMKAYKISTNDNYSGGCYDSNSDNECNMCGGFNEELFKKSFKVSKNVAKKIAGPSAKVVLPILAQQLGDTLNIPPIFSQAIGKAASEVINKEINNSLKKGEKEVGIYKGGRKTIVVKGNRGLLVKKIMRENNMNLSQASKYIKDNNLNY